MCRWSLDKRHSLIAPLSLSSACEMLPKTNHLLAVVTAVVANTVSQHVDSSLKCAISVISEGTLQKYVKPGWPSPHPLSHQLHGDNSKPTHQVTQDSPCDTSSSEYTLFTLPSQQSKPLKQMLRWNDTI